MRERAASAGFTLVETLVALAVVGVVSVALQKGLASSQRALARAEAVKEAVLAARVIFETELAEYAPGPGTREGVSRGLRVAVKSAPFELPFAPRPARSERSEPSAAAAAMRAAPTAPDEDRRWRPLLVTIRVEARLGAPVVVETLHVAPAP